MRVASRYDLAGVWPSRRRAWRFHLLTRRFRSSRSRPPSSRRRTPGRPAAGRSTGLPPRDERGSAHWRTNLRRMLACSGGSRSRDGGRARVIGTNFVHYCGLPHASGPGRGARRAPRMRATRAVSTEPQYGFDSDDIGDEGAVESGAAGSPRSRHCAFQQPSRSQWTARSWAQTIHPGTEVGAHTPAQDCAPGIRPTGSMMEVASSHVSTDEVYGSLELQPSCFTEADTVRAELTLRGEQSRGRPPGATPYHHPRVAPNTHDKQLLQQLRCLPISGKADLH